MNLTNTSKHYDTIEAKLTPEERRLITFHCGVHTTSIQFYRLIAKKDFTTPHGTEIKKGTIGGLTMNKNVCADDYSWIRSNVIITERLCSISDSEISMDIVGKNPFAGTSSVILKGNSHILNSVLSIRDGVINTSTLNSCNITADSFRMSNSTLRFSEVESPTTAIKLVNLSIITSQILLPKKSLRETLLIGFPHKAFTFEHVLINSISDVIQFSFAEWVVLSIYAQTPKSNGYLTQVYNDLQNMTHRLPADKLYKIFDIAEPPVIVASVIKSIHMHIKQREFP